MAALPRSEISFRRSGSSGLVWDDKLLSEELNPVKTKEAEDDTTAKVKQEQQRQTYRTVEVAPTVDPPSPKVSAGCGICFGKSKPEKKTMANKRSKPSAGRKS